MRPDDAAPAAPRGSSAALYLGFALTTGSMLLVQQFLTRVFTILFNSGLAFLAISTTFLGLGSAGVCVYVLPRLFTPERTRRLVPWLSVAYALSLVAGFLGLVALDHLAQARPGGAATALTAQVGRVFAASMLMLPALFLVGLVIALVLRANAARVHRLYGADLAGGGIGCLLVLPLMSWIGGDQGIFAIGALAAAGATLLAHAHGRAAATWAGALATAALTAAPLANRDLGIVDVRSHRAPLSGVESWVIESPERDRIWNELSRLGIFDTRDGSSLYVRIDSSCQTTIPSLAPRHVQEYVARADFEHLPYVLDRHRRYLEIGAGGGRGMVLAHAKGAERITGVEINPGIVAASLGRYPGYGVAPLVADGRHQLVVGEGRSYTRGLDELFDTVTITFIQTGIASSSAAFALSEANLFTVEAFTEFLGRLDPRGLFYVYRHSGNEMLRLIGLARAAFHALGVTDVRRHLYIARSKDNEAVLMASRGPFTDAEIASLDRACRERELTVLYSPAQVAGARPANPFPARVAELRAAGTLEMGAVVRLYRDLVHDPRYESMEHALVTSADPEAFLAGYLIDVRPTTDDRPYYFFFGLNRWADFLHYFDLDGPGILGGTVVLLFWMAAAFTVLVLLLILLPLGMRRGGAGAGRTLGCAVVLYFSGLGLGYIAVQISFIQRFTLFLGHPVYAISVVLLAFLLSSGAGSMASNRLFGEGRIGIRAAVLALAVLLLLYNHLLPGVFGSSLIRLPVAAKVLLSLALIFPLAFVMGFFFPQGIRLVERAAPQLIPWAWGANSAASVLGSIFALILAIHLGFTVVAVIAAATYVLCCIPSATVLRRSAHAA
ncbi:MAG: hypothetical protein IT458_14415 [Planctomycetes bacterium]|nr:hypothetical protein [Planctomycetota bacterium]